MSESPQSPQGHCTLSLPPALSPCLALPDSCFPEETGRAPCALTHMCDAREVQAHVLTSVQAGLWAFCQARGPKTNLECLRTEGTLGVAPLPADTTAA